MKEQFTQGDWGFQANDSYIELHAGGKMIGDLSMGSNTCTEAELKANARLFKVAPKMYEMLQELAQVARATGSKDEAEIINALLAEARGESKDTA